MKTLLTIAAVALATTTAQAKTATPAVPAADAAAVAAAPLASNKRLCVLEETTGSRLPVKTCKTAAEWDALGVKYRFKR